MTSIFEITDWSHLASFFVWTLAVCAIAKALFGSLPAAELQYRLSLRDVPRRQRMNRLGWEVNNRLKWDDDVARRSPHAARQPLTDAEIEAKRRELQQLARTSFAWRAFTYFMGCFACQTFWTGLALFVATRGMHRIDAAVLTAAASSGLAVWLSTIVPQVQSPKRDTANRGTCPGCGT